MLDYYDPIDVPDDLPYEVAEVALTALHGHTREMVERMRGEWKRIVDGYGKTEGFLCKCGCQSYSASNFCPSCGQPKTDEAVDMMLERWKEAEKDAKK